jgi:hypothetical protein
MPLPAHWISRLVFGNAFEKLSYFAVDSSSAAYSEVVALLTRKMM